MSALVRQNPQRLIDDVAALAQCGPLLTADGPAPKLTDRLSCGAEFQNAPKTAFPGKAVQADDYAATRETPDTEVQIALIQTTGQIVPGETEFGPLSAARPCSARKPSPTRSAMPPAQGKGGARDHPGPRYTPARRLRRLQHHPPGGIVAACHNNVPVIVSMGNGRRLGRLLHRLRRRNRDRGRSHHHRRLV